MARDQKQTDFVRGGESFNATHDIVGRVSDLQTSGIGPSDHNPFWQGTKLFFQFEHAFDRGHCWESREEGATVRLRYQREMVGSSPH